MTALIRSGDLPPGVDLLGPVFISYRVSDGSQLAQDIAWALRATGVPVWHDTTDLPPGDTSRRLEEALSGGLSGAVVLITPEIVNSTAVRDVELPRLLDLEQTSEFALILASVIAKQDDESSLNYEAPDRLLVQPEGTLKRVKQYPAFNDTQTTSLAHELALWRMSMNARLGRDPLVIDVQTRIAPRAAVGDVGLVVRLRPPTEGFRSPPRSVWAPLAAFLASLPKLAAESNASRIVIQGGAHLSVAFAIGAALPVTTGWPLTVVDRSGEWRSETEGPAEALTEESFELNPEGRAEAIFVDTVPGGAPVNTFQSYIAERSQEFVAGLRIALANDSVIPATSSAATVTEVANIIRKSASAHGVRRVSLFLRTPFPLALHLGRMLNTLTVDLLEWEDGVEPPRYLPTVTIASGRGASPIIEIAPNT
jgi:hypothetical protein